MDKSHTLLSEPATLKYSVVIPFYNEAGVALTVCQRCSRVMRHLRESYELILVNDGSGDGTGEVLAEFVRQDPHAVLLELRRNFGQTSALQAGFDHARGEVIIALDGDLQHDPYEIPFLVRQIARGYDVASGWRIRRGDNLFLRRFPSRVANWLLAKASGVWLHDFGTTFKAYRREILQDLRLYGDMHRFIPAACHRMGARICEVPIKNVRRKAGKSKYGLGRTFRVALDLLTLRFINTYLTRPLHFFGKWGLALGLGGAGILGYGLVRKLLNWSGFHLFVEHGPLMGLGFLLLVSALFFLAIGLMGEMMARIYFESSGKQTYAVRRVLTQADASAEDSAEPAPAPAQASEPAP